LPRPRAKATTRRMTDAAEPILKDFIRDRIRADLESGRI
jgi:hypothetical protein